MAFTDLFLIDSLAILMGLLISVISMIIFLFSRRYMDGDRRAKAYYKRLLALTCCALVLVCANHIALVIASWGGIAFLLSSLIGHRKDWNAANNAARFTRIHLVAGTGFLATGLGVLAWQTGQTELSAILSNISQINNTSIIISLLFFLAAAACQCALIPAHRWLMSSMTAPTPISAFMHAGLVNAGGFLIIRLSQLFTIVPEIMIFTFALGGLSALVGALWMSVQPQIKPSLAGSTVSQMGFMILQCGLGYFSAALAHLILHGFYKAYQFLNAGSAVAAPIPPKADSKPLSVAGWLGAVLCGVAGFALFITMTGKQLYPVDSGLILAGFAALAAMKFATGIVRMDHISMPFRIALSLTLTGGAVAVYSLLFITIDGWLAINQPQDMHAIHVVVFALFAAGWVARQAGWMKNSKVLYVMALNHSTSIKSATHSKREISHA